MGQKTDPNSVVRDHRLTWTADPPLTTGKQNCKQGALQDVEAHFVVRPIPATSQEQVRWAYVGVIQKILTSTKTFYG